MQELDALEAELRGAYNAGGADAFCVYLLGLVLLDKWVLGGNGCGGPLLARGLCSIECSNQGLYAHLGCL